MRKSNWIVLGVLLLCSIVFLWLWFYLRFAAVNWPLGLVLSIVWWVVIAVGVVIIARTAKGTRTTDQSDPKSLTKGAKHHG